MLATLSLACVTGPALRDPQARITPARLAALPTQVDAFTWGAQGQRVGDHELTETVRRNVDDSINYRLLQHGGRTFASAATARLEQFAAFYHWSWRAMHEIMAERSGQEPTTHRSVAEWKFPRDITSWQSALKADFVLVSFVLYGTRGADFCSERPVRLCGTAAEGSGLTGSGSRAIACAVALKDGRIVWCNFIPNNSVTMEERPAAQSAVDVLLGDLF